VTASAFGLGDLEKFALGPFRDCDHQLLLKKPVDASDSADAAKW
jgi:hypothetical protein